MPIRTAFTEAFNLMHPLVGAPMAGVSGPGLAAAVANAGGLGYLGAAFYKDPSQLRREYEEAVGLTEDSKGALGIGLVGFTAPSVFDEAIALKPGSILSAQWISFGELEPMAKRIKGAGIRLVVQVQSTDQAVQAAGWGADAIVAQSNESGGHGAAASTTFCFVPEVVSAVAGHAAASKTAPVPVLAAGGVVTGRQVAATLALGAAGAVLGTRLAVTLESLYSQAKKELYLAASGVQTARSRLWDDLGPLPWPAGVDGRAISNKFLEQHPVEELQQADVKEKLQAELKDAQTAGNLDVVAVWAGTGVGLVHSVEPAEPLVRSIAAEAAQTIKEMAQQVA